MSNTFNRALVEERKRSLLKALLDLPHDEMTDDEIDIMFILSFTPEQRKAILAQREEAN